MDAYWRTVLVAEGAYAGEDHGDAVLVAHFYSFIVLDAASRLDDGGDTGLAGIFDRILAGEREEGIRGENGAPCPIAGMLEGIVCCPEAVRLAAADTNRCAALR